MSSKLNQIIKTIEVLEDMLNELEILSVATGDFCTDEVIEMKEKLESIKDSTWKVGVIK